MAEKVKICSIKKNKEYLYYLNDSCDILRFKIVNNDMEEEHGDELIMRNDIKREKGYFYFIDSAGDISRLSLVKKKSKVS